MSSRCEIALSCFACDCFPVRRLNCVCASRLFCGGCLFPGAGLTDYKASKPWRLRITREGKAIQEISIIGAGAGVRRTSKSFVLSEEDMRGLAAVVEQANFFGLPNKISNSEFDHFAGCVLKITMV